MKTIIMAGGKGTRLSSISKNTPKPMVLVNGKPILEWQIDNLRKCGLTDITIVVGYLSKVIQDYFGDGSKFGVNINYFVEEHPLGTAGSLFKLGLNNEFILMCGDLITNVDFDKFVDFHRNNNALATLMTHPNNHPFDSSIVVTEILQPQEIGEIPYDSHRVINWIGCNEKRSYYKNKVNSGIEIISPLLLNSIINVNEVVDLDKDILKPNVSTGKIFSYNTYEYIKDAGIVDRLKEAENDFKTNKVYLRNSRNKQKAFFLDRDGVINKHVGYLTNPNQLEIIKGVPEAIKLINESEYLAIILTNQPVIARGDCSWEELIKIHNKLETELGEYGVFIDGLYVCPHHPDKGFIGERSEYKFDCECRKPKNGMLLKAAEDFNIDISQSIMIGDSEIDIKCGETSGCKKNILIKKNAEYSLLEVVKNIKG